MMIPVKITSLLLFRHQKGDGLFPETGLNLAEIFILCGFFLIYAVEEFTHLFLQKCCTPRGGRNEKVTKTSGLKV